MGSLDERMVRAIGMGESFAVCRGRAWARVGVGLHGCLYATRTPARIMFSLCRYDSNHRKTLLTLFFVFVQHIRSHTGEQRTCRSSLFLPFHSTLHFTLVLTSWC